MTASGQKCYLCRQHYFQTKKGYFDAGFSCPLSNQARFLINLSCTHNPCPAHSINQCSFLDINRIEVYRVPSQHIMISRDAFIMSSLITQNGIVTRRLLRWSRGFHMDCIHCTCISNLALIQLLCWEKTNLVHQPENYSMNVCVYIVDVCWVQFDLDVRVSLFFNHSSIFDRVSAFRFDMKLNSSDI